MKKILLLLLTLSVLGIARNLSAQGTAFTYQGQLQNGSGPVTGTYNLTFSLFTNSSGGTAVAGPLTNISVGVTNGLFTVTIDFGSNPFNGQTNWLQIGVETNGAGSFTTLSPRQKITPSPYSIFAETASIVSGTIAATQITGALPSSDLSGTYGGVLSLTNVNNTLKGSFTGNGGGLTNLNSANLVGDLADSQLSTNVPLLNANQTFTGVNTFSGANQGLIVNGGPIGTNLFTGLGLQFNPGSGEAAIISSLNDNRSFLTFYTKQGPGVPPQQQMKIDRNGVVMIDDQANNNGVLNDGTTNGASLVFGGNSGEGIASQRTPGVNQYGLDFYTGRTKQMSILNNGNIGIGTTNPTTALQVVGTVNATAFSGNGSGLTNLDASQLGNGTISPAQLPSNVLTNGEVGVTITGFINGIFNGTGTGLTGLNLSGTQGATIWQVASGTSVQAQPNNGYLLSNSKKVIVTLPASPDVGDVVEVFDSGAGGWMIAQNISQSVLYGYGLQSSGWSQSSAPSLWWSCMAASADGTKLAAAVGYGVGGGIYTSTDSGANWSQTSATNQQWSGIASSSDGTKLVAVSFQQQGFSGSIFTSTNSGATWTLRNTGSGSGPWYSVASSSDGTHLAAASRNDGGIYLSTNSGLSWSLSYPSSYSSSLASSSDGNTIVGLSGYVCITTNAGNNWIQQTLPSITDGTITWSQVACASDGKHMAVTGQRYSPASPGVVFISSDAGNTWTQTSLSTNSSWISVTLSADGSSVAATADPIYPGGGIYTSTDFGVTWNRTSAPTDKFFAQIVGSADGARLVGAIGAAEINWSIPNTGVQNGRIWTSGPNNNPLTTTAGTYGFLGGRAGSGVKLVYAGNGQFVVVNQQGSIYGL